MVIGEGGDACITPDCASAGYVLIGIRGSVRQGDACITTDRALPPHHVLPSVEGEVVRGAQVYVLIGIRVSVTC